ncbi:MAG: NADP-dependent oxidoreductase [Rhizobiaceae bacterium]|nr:NADP-dependent oxidoreductase [Rhizobiaceae bacterium]
MADAVEIRIERLPVGHVRADDFKAVSAVLKSPEHGEVHVRNKWMSLDPYMRLGLSPQAGYVAALNPGDMLNGPAVGIIEASGHPDFPVGSHVLSQMGWRSQFVSQPEDCGAALLVDVDVPLEWHLGLLGLTGVTAWLGISKVLRPQKGETIFISGAAGAVGSIACQMAKLRGARVLGSAGSPDKVDWLVNELGVDVATNYREQDLGAFLDENAPEGVDCYFDNVGGGMLDTFLVRTKPGGRIGLCGAMSQYEESDYRAGPANFFSVIENNLQLLGFNAFRLSGEEWAEATTELKRLVKEQGLKPCHSIVRGIKNASLAFAQMFEKGQLGKLLVEI